MRKHEKKSPEKHYSVSEIAEFFGWSKSTVYKKISSRQMASTKIGKYVYVTTSQLNEYIEVFGEIREAK